MQEQEKTGSQRAEEEAAAARKRKRPMPTLKHGFCVDLSFEHKFRCQLQELMKLPPWTKVVSAGNMLSHIGREKEIPYDLLIMCFRLILITLGRGQCFGSRFTETGSGSMYFTEAGSNPDPDPGFVYEKLF